MIDITSRENREVKRVCKLIQSRQSRLAEQVFVCEGLVLLQEALRSGLRVLQVFCLQGMEDRLPQLSCPVYRINQSVLEKISGVDSPQGIVFLCAMPPQLQQLPQGSRFLALEDLRDPGNLGTVLRTADAFGMDGVILLGDCVDRYSPKVVRSAMGSLFRVPVYQLERQSLRQQLRRAGIPLYGAALVENSKLIGQADLHRACVVIGNEARGLSEQMLALCDDMLLIPMRNVQSLNAAIAAAVFMWEMWK